MAWVEFQDCPLCVKSHAEVGAPKVVDETEQDAIVAHIRQDAGCGRLQLVIAVGETFGQERKQIILSCYTEASHHVHSRFRIFTHQRANELSLREHICFGVRVSP